MSTITTVQQLKDYILRYIREGHLDKESTPIVEYLIGINETSFISFESQPYTSTIYDNGTFIQRAYINGIYPKDKILQLVQHLPTGIVLSETRLNTNKDTLHIYGRTDYMTPLVSKFLVHHPGIAYTKELYPMFKNVTNTGVKWIRGYSGNIINPQSRDYITNLFFEFNEELTAEIIRDYSIVQIWPENIDNILFPTVLNYLLMVD
jgi:hypothetical protein